VNLGCLGGGACGGLLCPCIYLTCCLFFVLQTKRTLVSCVFLARIQSYPITLDKLAENSQLKEILTEVKDIKLVLNYILHLLSCDPIEEEDSEDECISMERSERSNGGRGVQGKIQRSS